MIKMGLFALLAVGLTACGLSDNEVTIAQAQSMIEAARAAQDASHAAQTTSQGLSDMARGQIFILVLLTLIFVALLGIVFYLIMYRQIKIPSFCQAKHGRWISGPNARSGKIEEPDLYQQMLSEQQWLLTQLLSQGSDETEIHDLPDLPGGWWG